MPGAEQIGFITNPYFSGCHVMDIERFSQSIDLKFLDHKHLRGGKILSELICWIIS